MKKCFLALSIICALLLILCLNHVQMSRSYYQEAKSAAVSVIEHIDSMNYNLDMLVESTDTREMEAAVTFIYLHAVMCEEDLTVIEKYCKAYSMSLVGKMFGPDVSGSLSGEFLMLKDDLAAFQNYLEGLCLHGIDYVGIDALHERMNIANNHLLVAKSYLDETKFTSTNTAKQMIEMLLTIIHDINFELND